MFSATSRYHDLPVRRARHARRHGRALHGRAGSSPTPAAPSSSAPRSSAAGDRLDRIAAERYGDPEQAWRIADGHRVLDPDLLTAVPGSVVLLHAAGGPAAARRGPSGRGHRWLTTCS